MRIGISGEVESPTMGWPVGVEWALYLTTFFSRPPLASGSRPFVRRLCEILGIGASLRHIQFRRSRRLVTLPFRVRFGFKVDELCWHGEAATRRFHNRRDLQQQVLASTQELKIVAG